MPERALIPRKTASWMVDLLFLAGLALFLRLWGITHESVWMDEYISAARLDSPGFGAFIESQKGDNPDLVPLYYALQYYCAKLAPGSILWLRLISVAMGCAAVPVLYAWGRRSFGRLAGFAAACCLCLSPLHIFHGQNIRVYAMVTLLALVSLWALSEWTVGGRGGKRWLALHLVMNLTLVWTHLFTPLLFAAQGLFLLLSGPKKWRRNFLWGVAHVLIVLSVLPWVATLKPAPDPGVPPPEAGSLARLVAVRDAEPRNDLAGFMFYPDNELLRWTIGFPPKYNEAELPPGTVFWLSLRQPLELALARTYLLGTVLCMLVLFRSWREGRGGGAVHWAARAPALPLLGFLAPVLLLFAAAVFWKHHAFQTRYVMFAWPCLYLACAGAAAGLRWRGARWGLAALLIVPLAWSARLELLLPVRQDFLGMAGLLRERAAETDTALTNDWNLRRVLLFNAPDLGVPVLHEPDAASIPAQTAAILGEGRGAWCLYSGRESLQQRQELESMLKRNGVLYDRHVFLGMHNLYAYRCLPPGG